MQNRKKANRKRVPRKTGVAHASPGTVRGRSRKKPPRKTPVRSRKQQQSRAEQFLGFGGAIFTK
jgi:hypothetical protein